MQIREEVRQFIIKNFMLGGNSKELRDDDSFLEKGIVDSTGVLELVAFLEESFQVSVADEELVPENLDSIGNIVVYLGRKKAMSSHVA